MGHQPDNIAAGTQIISSVPIRGTNGALVHPRGAVRLLRLLLCGAGALREGRVPVRVSEETCAQLSKLLVQLRMNSPATSGQ